MDSFQGFLAITQADISHSACLLSEFPGTNAHSSAAEGRGAANSGPRCVATEGKPHLDSQFCVHFHWLFLVSSCLGIRKNHSFLKQLQLPKIGKVRCSQVINHCTDGKIFFLLNSQRLSELETNPLESSGVQGLQLAQLDQVAFEQCPWSSF